MTPAERGAAVNAWRPILESIYERAKDRNQQTEPDKLHLAYEAEILRLNAMILRPRVQLTEEVVMVADEAQDEAPGNHLHQMRAALTAGLLALGFEVEQ